MEVNLHFWLKLGIFLGLFAGFAATSFGAFLSYLSGQTMISSSIVEHPEGQIPPEIMICNKTAYKELKYYMTEDEFLENTLKLEDFFVSFDKKILSSDNSNMSEIDYDIVPINTIFRGRCYILKVNVKVTLGDMMLLKINTKQKLKVQLLHPEERIMTVFDISTSLPIYQELGHEDGMMDFEIETVIRKKESKCKSYSEETGRKGNFLHAEFSQLNDKLHIGMFHEVLFRCRKRRPTT